MLSLDLGSSNIVVSYLHEEMQTRRGLVSLYYGLSKSLICCISYSDLIRLAKIKTDIRIISEGPKLIKKICALLILQTPGKDL